MTEFSENVGNVLIVDDQEDFRSLLSSALSRFCIVQTASSVRSALERLSRFNFDLIILDISLADGNGFDIARVVNSKGSYAPSIVFMTGLAGDRMREESWAHQAEDFFAKPFNVREFCQKISNRLANIRALQDRHIGSRLAGVDLSLIDCNQAERTAVELEFLTKLLEEFLINSSDPNIDISYIAKKMGMSRRCFQRKIASSTDLGFSILLRQFRTRTAAILLKEGYSVKDVARRSGFSSASYFSTSFKQEFGHSPREYQKMSTVA